MKAQIKISKATLHELIENHIIKEIGRGIVCDSMIGRFDDLTKEEPCLETILVETHFPINKTKKKLFDDCSAETNKNKLHKSCPQFGEGYRATWSKCQSCSAKDKCKEVLTNRLQKIAFSLSKLDSIIIKPVCFGKGADLRMTKCKHCQLISLCRAQERLSKDLTRIQIPLTLDELKKKIAA